MRKLFVLVAFCLGFGVGLSAPAFAQAAAPVPAGYAPAQTYGMAAKKPVSSGACSFCPWGALAEVVKEASQATQWDVQICYTCSGGNSVLLPATHKIPGPINAVQIAEGSRPPPYAPVDFGVSQLGGVRDAYLGQGAYKDTPFKNLRLIARIQSPSYLVVAVKDSSGITSLADIKNKKMPVKIFSSGSDTILAYYGITKEALESWGGSIGPVSGGGGGARGGAPPPPRPENYGNRPLSVPDYDVYIKSASMANNTENQFFTEITQMQKLDFLQLPDDLLNKLVQSQFASKLVVMPQAYFAGVDRNIKTVGGVGGTAVFSRDDAPDDFSYDIAKALDQHQDLFQWKVLRFSYNSAIVADGLGVPLAAGAARYYREVGYIK